MRNLHLEVERQNKADAQQGGDADEDEQMLLEPEERIEYSTFSPDPRC